MDANTLRTEAGTTNGRAKNDTRDSASPPHVTRGAKCAKGVYLAIDWVRFVGSQSNLKRTRLWLEQRFNCLPESIPGRHYCAVGEAFTAGVSMMYGHAAEIIIVELTGKALANLTADERIEIVRHFHREGFRASRLDLCADFVEQGVHIVDSVRGSCGAEELCRAHTYDTIDKRTKAESRGKTVYMGQRGKKGSGRLGRVYDKGLETETAPEGVWERYEIEYTKDTAARVAAMLAIGSDWAETARALLLGAFDFRKVTGNAHLESRPRVQWWAEIIGMVETIRITLPRPPAELHKFARWAGRCVFPTFLAMAETMNGTIDALRLKLVGDEVVAKVSKYGSTIEQFSDWLKDQTISIEDLPTSRLSPA